MMFERFGARRIRERLVLDKEKLEKELGHLAKGLTVRLLGYVATICRLRDPLVHELAEDWEKLIRERVSSMLQRVQEGFPDE